MAKFSPPLPASKVKSNFVLHICVKGEKQKRDTTRKPETHNTLAVFLEEISASDVETDSVCDVINNVGI